MAQKFLSYSPAPVETAVIDPKRGVLTQPWERWFDRLKDSVLKRPSCHVSFTADQSIANSTQQDVLWTAEDHDNAAMHDVSTNTDRITIPSNGIYCAGVHIGYAAHATGQRQVRLTLNDAAPAAAGALLVLSNPLASSFANNTPYLVVSVTRKLTAGDVLRAEAYQTSGGALNGLGTTSAGPYTNGFWCFRVSVT